ncbi:NUDIX domain-containing protein [Nonlabens ulvanivorans]|uniref:NUDIX domain-containing protein n=1 Tax=Nonlabens ulvanivorans TaxID=906888 RepID=UPI0037CB09BE
MKYSINNEKTVYNGFFKVLEAQVTHDKIKQSGSIEATRICLERGDSVAVLIYETDTDSFLFTKQFRYPSARRNHPWMLELVAGSVEEGENPMDCAQREIEEEIGYETNELELITTYFPSPGGCSEQIHLYYTEVNSSQKTLKGGGAVSEKEDIELIKIKCNDIKKQLDEGAFNNSISLIGIQWYLLNKRLA